MENRDSDLDSATHRRIAMLMGGSPSRQAELAGLARLSGCVPIAQNREEASDFLLADICSESDRLADSLSEIAAYLLRHRSIALVWTDMDGLDKAYAHLPPEHCHFLVAGSDIDAIPILAGAFGRGGMNRLYDRNREVEFGALHRISDELAEFARTLSRMAEKQQERGVSDKPVSFRPAPPGGFQAFPVRSARAPTANANMLRDIIRKRRLRERFFGTELFADPAWDILLDLKAASLEGGQVSVSSLCIAASVPPTTALRWIATMTESGMLVRRQDPDDARRVFIELSDEAAAKLDDYFAAALSDSAQTIL